MRSAGGCRRWLAGGADWQRWGTGVSDRAWGTVREDYSADGNAGITFRTIARSRRIVERRRPRRLCDREQHLCLGVALWNERDPILKERLFGLTNREGNHGEDVKEHYFYLDNTPTHSYARMRISIRRSRIRMRSWSRRMRAAAATSRNTSLFDAIRRCVRAAALFRRVRRIREG